MERLEDNMVSLQDYAAQKGISYEAVRSQVKRYENDKNLTEHIHKVGRTRYLDEEAVDYLDKRRSSSPVVVVSGEKNHKIEDLELQVRELTQKLEEQRSQKEELMQEIIALQKKTNEIDTSKYMLIEDHKKTEEKLQEKNAEIEQLQQNNDEKGEAIDKLKKENDRLKADSDALRDVTIKLSKLNNEIEEKRNQIDSKNNEMLELKQKMIDTEAENRKIQDEKTKLEEEKRRIEDEKQKAEEESMENLSLGFFARRRKLKELKKRNQN